ncbi:MAG: hypothetical protein KDK64_08130, partial [Chlamydiia bacterium]|nr:hypothetical protein [Chlamydiia bacterium]
MEYLVALFPAALAVYFYVKWQRAREENIHLKAGRASEEKLSMTFRALSSEALEKSNASFLQLAKETLGKFQEKAKGDLEKRQETSEHVL